jgi:outer membrane murein-binding lipoprotein Lpp
MNRKSIVIILITVLIGALLSGCVDNPKTESQVTPAQTVVQTPAVKELEGTIRVSGANMGRRIQEAASKSKF